MFLTPNEIPFPFSLLGSHAPRSLQALQVSVGWGRFRACGSLWELEHSHASQNKLPKCVHSLFDKYVWPLSARRVSCSSSSGFLDARFVRQSTIWYRASVHFKSDSRFVARVLTQARSMALRRCEPRRADFCSLSPTTLVVFFIVPSLLSKLKSCSRPPAPSCPQPAQLSHASRRTACLGCQLAAHHSLDCLAAPTQG